jgi:hypothetical protein
MPLLVLLLLTVCAAAEEVIAPPRGIFASAGSTRPGLAAHAQVRGALVRATWQELEPAPGAFAWDAIERQAAPLRSAGKGWSLGVVAGPHAPAWLYQAPHRIPPLAITFRREPRQVPCPWDAALHARLAALAQALGDRYAGDPALRLVYLPQMSANGIEGHFNGNRADDLTRQGLTAERWAEATLRTARTFSASFPRTALAVELHELPDGLDAPRRILEGIQADARLRRQCGAAAWWLSGREDYQAGLLRLLAGFPGPLYGQLIARGDQAERFGPGGLPGALAQARRMGMRYVEPWEPDILSGRFAAELEEFNRWAEADGR